MTVTKSQGLHPASDDPVRAAYASLVRAAASGDRAAMERLLVRAQEVAYRFSLLVCGHPEDAEDVMQDALIKTYKHVNQIHEPAAFRTWLYRTVRNACLMKRRRRVDEPAHVVSIEQARDAGDGEGEAVEVRDRSRLADQQLMDTWVGEQLRRALQALPPASRAVVVLRDIEGLSTKEVASILRVSEDTVKTRLHRARLRMRRHLEGVPAT
jgi:RNA polymerase sigma-70 factor, ECF subfamily